MTEDQKSALSMHVYLHKPIPRNGENGEVYFLQDGMTVEFTDCENYSNNSKYQVNNDKCNYIWFSQLSNIFITDELTLIATNIINKYGTAKQIRDYDSYSFWKEVKGKKYRIDVVGTYYIINKKSKTADEKQLWSMQSIYDYVKSCIERNRIGEIGDCLKTAQAYSLAEI